MLQVLVYGLGLALGVLGIEAWTCAGVVESMGMDLC